MKISVDFDRDLHPVSQLILALLYQGEYELIKKHFSVIAPMHLQSLYEKRYILSEGPYDLKSLGDIAVSTTKSRALFGELSTSASWIDEYRELFKGKKIGSMGSRSACIVKMDRFLSQYPYTKAVVISATERYINSQREQGYKFLQRADYFIFKNEDMDGSKILGSRLATFCEEIEMLNAGQINLPTWHKKAI